MSTELLKVAPHGDREIRLERTFDAPRARVFDAFTKPALLERWLGPRGWSVGSCDIDLKVGGRYALRLLGPNDADVTMRGVFREIVPPERIVHVESVEDGPGPVVTTEFAERQGKTMLQVTMRYPSRQDRDATIQSGMQSGAAQSYDKLAELLANATK